MEYIPHLLIPWYCETCMQAKLKPYIRRVKNVIFHSSAWFESPLGTSVLYRVNTLYFKP